MTEQLKHLSTSADVEKVRTEVATLAVKLEGKADATDIRELKGRVGRIPTVPAMVGLFTLAGIVSAYWPWISLHVLHITG